MVVQYSKFLKMGLECKWRGDVAAMTYIETSTWTRQGRCCARLNHTLGDKLTT